MKRITLLTMAGLAALTLFNGCYIGGERVTGDGHVIKKERDIGAFSRLTVAGSMEVYIRQGEAGPVVIEAEDNLIPYIETTLEGDRLRVKFKNNVSVSSHHPVNVYITTPSIGSILLAGSGDIFSEDQLRSTDRIDLSLAGSGNMKLLLDAPLVKADIAGSGDMEVAGDTKEVEVHIVGSGNFQGQKLMSENASLDIAGSGDAFVYASVHLDAKILGSGNVTYQGNAQVSSKVMGSGELIKK